jgi:hypothetical protein
MRAMAPPLWQELPPRYSVIALAPTRQGRPYGALDRLLGEEGLARRVVAVVPTFTSAAHLILTSDLTGLLPARYAEQVAAIGVS